MKYRIRLEERPAPLHRRVVERYLSQWLRLPLSAVQALLRCLPLEVEGQMDESSTSRICRDLAKRGMKSSVLEVPDGTDTRCAMHRSLLATKHCAACAEAICAVCADLYEGRCASCNQKERRKTRAFHARLLVLSVCLFFVLLLAVKEWRRRHLGWETPQRVAVVMVAKEGAALSPELATSFRSQTEKVETTLLEQIRRYRPNAGLPVKLFALGPVEEGKSPPDPPQGGLLDLLLFQSAAYGLRRDDRRGCGARSGALRRPHLCSHFRIRRFAGDRGGPGPRTRTHRSGYHTGHAQGS